jgi:hypothetical protein
MARDETLASCNAIPPTTGKRKLGVLEGSEKGSRFNPIMIDNIDVELPEEYGNLYDDVPSTVKKRKRNGFTLPEERSHLPVVLGKTASREICTRSQTSAASAIAGFELSGGLRGGEIRV